MIQNYYHVYTDDDDDDGQKYTIDTRKKSIARREQHSLKESCKYPSLSPQLYIADCLFINWFALLHFLFCQLFVLCANSAVVSFFLLHHICVCTFVTIMGLCFVRLSLFPPALWVRRLG